MIKNNSNSIDPKVRKKKKNIKKWRGKFSDDKFEPKYLHSKGNHKKKKKKDNLQKEENGFKQCNWQELSLFIQTTYTT